MDPKIKTRHVLDYLVGESRRDVVLSIIQIILYTLAIGIMFMVLYLLIKKVLPVTDKVLPLVTTQLLPSVAQAEPVITDVLKTIRNKSYKPKEELSKIIGDIIWRSGPKDSPTTNIGRTVQSVEDISLLIQFLIAAVCSVLPKDTCLKAGIRPEDMTGDNFDSLRSLAKYLKEKGTTSRARRPAPASLPRRGAARAGH